MGHFSSLAESTSAISNELHAFIRIHPAFSYIRTGYLYDEMYDRFRSKCDNLSEARLRTVLHVIHILDEIAHSLGIISSEVHYSIPEHIFIDAFSNPKYKAYSDKVTPESRLRQQQRLRQKELDNAAPAASIANVNAAALSDPFNSLMHNFTKPKLKTPSKE